MPKIVEIPLADLLVDLRNARLPIERASQQDALLAIAELEGPRLLKLAADIRKNGLDPMQPVGVRELERTGKFLVVEGNRRVTALKALESPGIVAGAFSSTSQRRLARLAATPPAVGTDPVRCVVFNGPDELAKLDHFVTLRHTGMNEGVGLMEWGPEEKDRYLARHGHRSPAGQVLDVVRAYTGREYRPKGRKEGYLTTITRLVTNPVVRDRLGIDVSDGQLVSWYPTEEVMKGLVKMVDDLAEGKEDSRTLHHRESRERYARSLSTKHVPAKKTKLSAPIPLLPTAAPVAEPDQPLEKRKKTKRPADPGDRKCLVPSKGSHLNVTPSRIAKLYGELCSLEVEEYPNACAVALRVFAELSVDHVIETKTLMTDAELQARNKPLAFRMKLVASHLREHADMPTALERAIVKIADGDRVLAASVNNFNQYVHNKYVHPKPGELRTAWDELQPFFEFLWP